MPRFYQLSLLLAAVLSFTAISLNGQSCSLLSGNIDLGGAAHDPGFQENDAVNTVATLSNGNFVVAWETRDDVDGSGSGAYFRLFAQDGTPLTDPTIPYADVNPAGTGSQGNFGPKVVALNNGFVIAWESEDGPGDEGPVGDDQQDIYFRIYDNSATALTGSTELSITAQEDQLEQVLPLSSGGFVVLWSIDEDDTGNNDDYYFQVFNASGMLTSGAPVNISGGAHDAAFQTVDAAQSMVDLGNGTFAVAWEARDDIDGDGNGGFFRIFNTDGTPVTGVITPYADVNPSGTGDQGTPGPRLALLTGGNLVVSWDSENGPGDVGPGMEDDQDVYFRVYQPNGTPVSGTVKANSDNAAEEEYLRGIIALAGGNFAILYRNDEDETGNTDDYFVRVFTSAGAVASATQELSGGAHVNNFKSVLPNNDGFTALSNGNFVVGWAARDGADGEDAGIFYRVFGPTGFPVHDVTMPYADINPGGAGNQSASGPIIKALPSGFAISWQSEQGPGDVGPGNNDDQDVYHRVIDNDGMPLCGTTKTNTGNEAEEEVLEVVHPLANGDFVVVYKDDEDETGNLDDYFLRVIGGAPAMVVCPTIDLVSASTAAICVGETATFSALGLQDMSQAFNNDQDYGINFVAFSDQTEDPYSGGDVLLSIPFGELSNGGTTASTTPITFNSANPNQHVYAILSPLPSDADCRPFAFFALAVNAYPTPSLATPASWCFDAGVQTGLGGGMPTGGVYSGPGVTDDGNGMTYSFDPAAAGVGSFTITYTLTENNCTASVTAGVEVFALPVVGFTAPDGLMANAGLQTGLGGGIPTGGIYSGPGVTDDGNGTTYSFDPAAAGEGTHTLTYTYTDGNGCSSSFTDDIEVLPAELVITPIDNINDLDANGVAMSLGQTVAVQGIVHCIDFLNDDQLQFYLMEANGDGIGVYSAQPVDSYVVTEGDEVIVEGAVSQYGGSLEIEPTGITVVSQNNDLLAPLMVDALAENLENKLVTLMITNDDTENVTIAAVTGGQLVTFPIAGGTQSVRVWEATGVTMEALALYVETAGLTPVSHFVITGIVVQEDFESPLNDNYVLYPCGEGSFDYIVGTEEPAWGTALRLFPNPTGDRLRIDAPVAIETIILRDLQGRELQRETVHSPSHELDLNRLPQGVYQVQVIGDGGVVIRKVVKG